MARLKRQIELDPADEVRVRAGLLSSLAAIYQRKVTKLKGKAGVSYLTEQRRADAAAALASGEPSDLLTIDRKAEGFCMTIVGRVMNELRRGTYQFHDARVYARPKEARGHMLSGRALEAVINEPDFKSRYRLIFQPHLQDAMVLGFLHDELMEAWDDHLSECTFAYRRKTRRDDRSQKLNVKTALSKAYEAMTAPAQGQPMRWVCKADIRRYFDSLPHDLLRAKVRQRVEDPLLIYLLDQHLEQCGGALGTPGTGVLHGFSVSGVLSNIYLDNVDKIMAKRSGKYLRYVDDVLLVCKDQTTLEQQVARLLALVEVEGLEVPTKNPEKFQMVCLDPTVDTLPDAYAGEVEYLGFRFEANASGELDVRIRESSLSKMREKIHRVIERFRDDPRSSFERARRTGEPFSRWDRRRKRAKSMIQRINYVLGYEGIGDKATYDPKRGWPGYYLSSFQNPTTRAQHEAMERYIRDVLRHYMYGKRATGHSAEEVKRFNNWLREHGLLPYPIGKWRPAPQRGETCDGEHDPLMPIPF